MNIEETLKAESKEQILENLRNDEKYYGEYGQQFLSNSNIGQLLSDPKSFNKPSEKSVPMFVGGAFHTMMLEPHKMDKYKLIQIKGRNTKKYEEESNGEMCLTLNDMSMLENLRAALVDHPFRFGGKSLLDLVQDGEAEVPGYANIYGQWWKGKADVVSHDAKLIIDLKTTSNLEGFEDSAKKFNYNSQAFIYRELFGYDMVFLAFDKKTNRIGFFDCSDEFYEEGREKVIEAIYAYKTHIINEEEKEFDYSNFLLQKTL